MRRPPTDHRLQEQIVKQDSVFQSRTNMILNNLNHQLPTLANEDKIENQLDDEEQLVNLYKQVRTRTPRPLHVCWLRPLDDGKEKHDLAEEEKYAQGEIERNGSSKKRHAWQIQVFLLFNNQES